MSILNITMDGPAGSGKSTVADIIAERLDILHLDTGAMYRALGYKALISGIEPSDRERVVPMLDSTEVRVELSDGCQKVYVDGTDVSGKIRENPVSKAASDIAVIPEVRIKLVEIQRKLAESMSMVIDGRDIGSYVLPNAPHKFFLTADARERAKRRLNELHAKGMDTDKTLDEMTEEILARDKTDSTREFAPLKCPEDAVTIDTTNITAQQVADIIMENIQKKMA